jgi:hypothetical protein
MNGLRVFVVAAIAVVVGVFAYQLGLSQGLATALPAGAAPAAYYGYPHWGFGFGFLGLLFPLLFFFLIFGALRAAWWGGRGGYGPKGWGGNGRARIEELHRELHGEKPSGDRPSSTST